MPGHRKVLSVVGTRPNFMKVAPVIAALAGRPDEFEHVLVHTGQHYDDALSQVFFEELGVPEPDHMLQVGSGSHAQQTARVMEGVEAVLLEEEPDVVLVPGDVNSTLAAALVAAKLQIAVAHVEAGLRSFDWTMPEELNRVVADRVSKILFIHSPEARTNLLREGIEGSRIHFVGNTMIDTLVSMRERIDSSPAEAVAGLQRGSYVVVTLHRPALVDGPMLPTTFERLRALSDRVPLVFPVHPRTRGAMEALGLRSDDDRLRVVEPLPYLSFMNAVAGAAGVLTDSGGIQEETTYLGVPCFTLRDNTERPVTIELGTNVLLGLDPERISDVPGLIEEARDRESRIPEHWDGHAAERIADVLAAEAVGSGRLTSV